MTILLQKLAWIPGTIFGGALSWEIIGQSIFTIITSMTIAAANYFLVRYLSKKFPNKNRPKPS